MMTYNIDIAELEKHCGSFSFWNANCLSSVVDGFKFLSHSFSLTPGRGSTGHRQKKPSKRDCIELEEAHGTAASPARTSAL